ncbi:L-methionine sulfoximine/L-methionine sulfone acetyltransferase [Microbacterium oleivorans]|nr:L-methionine sulfoximine/L-methionine sulfone acetyltransferase [Microbacterium oleivorans]
MTGTTIRAMRGDDWPQVESIYREGIAAGNATFESDPPSWDDFDEGKLHIGRLVAADPTGTVLGWIAASRVSTREVYRGVVEHSVYVADRAHGRGVGTALLSTFMSEAVRAGVWTIQASVFPENTASLTLHERAGFRRIGHRERIAYMTHGPWAGTWRDTVLVERRLS